jgi:Divergent InlB B-repeat domain
MFRDRAALFWRNYRSQTVTATAKSGYSFVNWTASGSVVSTSASYTLTLNSNVTLVANFVRLPQ